ncbi:MAG: hypothetical protein ACM3MG_04720 [Bacillota bacterium]
MKSYLILLFAFSLSLGAKESLAMAKKITVENESIDIKDEQVFHQKISDNFQLRATDGSLIQIRTKEWTQATLINKLPKENPDQSLCTPGNRSTNHFITLLNIANRLLNKGNITTADVVIIKKTPRCEPFTPALLLIASSQFPESDNEDGISSISVVTNNKNESFVTLNMESDKKVAFRIAEIPVKLRTLRDLDKVIISPSSSGQNLGIRFKLTDANINAPTESVSTEACTHEEISHSCFYPKNGGTEICGETRTSRPGSRQVHTTNYTTSYSISIELINFKGKTVLSGMLSDSSSWSSSNSSQCL